MPPGFFDYCEPQLVIVSDEEKKYETQEVDYRAAANPSGFVVNGSQRIVLYTLKDGVITIGTYPGSRHRRYRRQFPLTGKTVALG